MPPTQLAPMPEEFREWAQDTLLATMAGMVFGGGKSWLEESRRGEGGRGSAMVMLGLDYCAAAAAVPA